MFVGLDAIFDAFERRWFLLEANERPAGFALSDAFRRMAVGPPREPTAAECIANAIRRRSKGARVAYIVPAYVYCPAVLADPVEARRVGDLIDKGSLGLLADDFVSLASCLSGALIPVRPDDLYVYRGKLLDRTGCEFDFVFSMSPAVPPRLSDEFVLNSSLIRQVCTDKLEFAETFGHDLVVPTFDRIGDELLRLCHSGYAVRKPRYGSASVEVCRLPLCDITARHQTLSKHGIIDYVYQPWIRGATLTCPEGHAYRFDVRLLLCDSHLIGGFVRRCAASVGGAGSETDLAWITTTGRTSPLSDLRVADDAAELPAKNSLSELAALFCDRLKALTGCC